MQRIENIEEIVIIEDIDVVTIGIKRKDEEDEILTIYKLEDLEGCAKKSCYFINMQEKIKSMREFLRVFKLINKVKFI